MVDVGGKPETERVAVARGRSSLATRNRGDDPPGSDEKGGCIYGCPSGGHSGSKTHRRPDSALPSPGALPGGRLTWKWMMPFRE